MHRVLGGSKKQGPWRSDTGLHKLASWTWNVTSLVGSLLFADDVVLLAPSVRDLQLSLDRFAAECEAARDENQTLRI